VSSDLAVDRLPPAGPALEVVELADASFGADSARGPRRPHRHDYHELIWTRRGAVEPGTVTLIGRGQVHVFARANGLHGAVVRFGDELLRGETASAWLFERRGSRTFDVPRSDVPRLEATIDSLAAEARRPPDACTVELERHLLSTLLLWLERWYDASRTGRRDADDADVQVYRRFVELLERDFARHHDVGHYADALRIPPAALSKALSRVSGRATKEHVTDRVMLEAARLLRFTDLSVGEIAFRVGLGDQLYFSRAFKRHYGESPMAYRERVRARSVA
jgi:AraC family transcriptional regulator, transcriptional activator of pobA